MSRFFFFLGVISILAAGYLIWQRYSPTRLAFNAMVLPATKDRTEIVPTSIEIEDLGLALSIISEELIDNTWPMSNRGVVYLANTPRPGDRGNSILYGHNWPNILGRLTRIKPGATISIGFNNGERRMFIVEYTQEVTPDQTHILASTDDRRITLYTCTGFFDQKRFVVTAIAEEESTNLQISSFPAEY
ncbi:hypothetical protein A2971_04315 [Candidatus Gottesmanbacteria bacterium RIFCSPLOWO2_01_FULL_46_21]|uniref:Sortase n=1 Tax=Candidatus Gottesmanbacteria bacterium RIFCSPLOWO2_01_FULL_46_21 TaxID=1798393 RepID=A0A1F6AZ79_9BACT|nr:MAG: hypothetical protein A2971_04315 [Candidatus Gottesmanbacteria bacterium RIFCSPLOWO2_01_FULL_46_21]